MTLKLSEIERAATEQGFEYVNTVLDANDKLLAHFTKEFFHLYVGEDGVAYMEREVALSTHNFNLMYDSLGIQFKTFKDNVNSLFKD